MYTDITNTHTRTHIYMCNFIQAELSTSFFKFIVSYRILDSADTTLAFVCCFMQTAIVCSIISLIVSAILLLKCCYTVADGATTFLQPTAGASKTFGGIILEASSLGLSRTRWSQEMRAIKRPSMMYVAQIADFFLIVNDPNLNCIGILNQSRVVVLTHALVSWATVAGLLGLIVRR